MLVRDYINEIPISKDIVDRVTISKNVNYELLEQKEVVSLVLMAYVASNKIEEVKHVLEDFVQIEQVFKSIDKSQYQKIISTYDDLLIIEGCKLLLSIGFALRKESSHEALPKLHIRLSEITGKDIYFNNDQVRLSSFAYQGFEGVVDVQAYGGTGKTLTLSAIAKTLATTSDSNVIWITRSEELKNNVFHMCGNGVKAITYYELCEELVCPKKTWGKCYKKRLDMQTIIRKLGIHSLTPKEVGNYSPMEVYKFANQTVKRFCISTSTKISSYHLPEWMQKGYHQVKDTILFLAHRLWDFILNDSSIPVEVFHHVKFVQLDNRRILKLKIDYLLVDEVQELPPSVMRIINILIGRYDSEQRLQVKGCFIAGDEYQSFGYANEWVTNKAANVNLNEANRQRNYLSRSERFGAEIGNVASSILMQRASYEGNKLQASQRVNSRVMQFDWSNFDIRSLTKEQPIVFLGDDLWSVIEWAHRYKHQNIPIFFPAQTKAELVDLVIATVQLIKTKRVYHQIFSSASSWEDYVHKKNSNLIDRIDDMFIKNGYSESNIRELISYASKTPFYAHTICLIEHYKGMQNDRVVLLPGVGLFEKKEKTDKKVKYYTEENERSRQNKRANRLYTGATRASIELWLPMGTKLDSI